MKDISGIYKIINVKNGKYYLGSSSKINTRFKRHLNDMKNNNHSNDYLQRIWNKHGNCFKLEIVEIIENKNLFDIEQTYLDEIFKNDKMNIYNISESACGGDNLTNNPNRDIIIEKIRKSINIRYENESIYEKEERKNRCLGEKNPNYNNKWTKEQRKKMSDYRKNKPSKIKGKTYEEIHGLYKAKKLKKIISDRAKNNIGEKNPFYGKKHSDENLKFFSESQKGIRRSSCLKKTRPFIINDKEYLFLKDAAEDYNVSYPAIIYRLKSKSDKYKKYYYIEDKDRIEEIKNNYS